MLWSLLKIVVFVAIVGALAVGGQSLLGMSGGVQITVAGTEYTLTALQSVIALLALMFVLWVLLKLASLLIATLRFVNGDETALSRYFDRSRERKGFKALSEGMMALASGEGKLAMAKAAKAEKYLQKPELTNLLTAQAAEVAGDRVKAEATYKKLVADERTRFVGVRGILKQKLADGDTETALKLAERAFAIKPRHEETQDALLRLQAEKEDWRGARKTLNAKLKHGAMPRDLHRRRDAVLALAHAQDAMAQGKMEDAAADARQANKLAPTLVPAAAMAARFAISDGKARAATQIIKKAWQDLPHPDLAAVFAEIVPEETPQERIKRFKPLLAKHADHPEVHMLEAELQIAADDFPAARRALGDLTETDPTVRSLTIMAAIERGSGAEDAIVRAWLAKAVTASRGPQWVCDVDGKAYGTWQAMTDGGFDTLSWKTPESSDAAMPTSAVMLPLIVGALEDKSEETVVDATPSPDEVSTEEVVPGAEIAEASEGSGEDSAAADVAPAEEARKAS